MVGIKALSLTTTVYGGGFGLRSRTSASYGFARHQAFELNVFSDLNGFRRNKPSNNFRRVSFGQQVRRHNWKSSVVEIASGEIGSETSTGWISALQVLLQGLSKGASALVSAVQFSARMIALVASLTAALLIPVVPAFARRVPVPEPPAPSVWEQALPYALIGLGIVAVVAAAAFAVTKYLRQAREINASEPLVSEGSMSVRDALKKVYFAKVRPLEQDYGFGNFHSPCLTAGDFNAKPSVLLIGQYSTGKTTFIRHLLKRDYPGILIGPEPTTDRFVVVSHGEQDVRTPGNTVVITGTKPYQALATYGEGFLSRFEEVQLNHELLQGLSLIDTPGVLAGEKQRLHRAYNFIDVCAWFASRCDMILLLFDPFKLDISDEFRQVIDAMKDHHDKIRVVLNKADQVSSQELMRVYGALMWSLAKVLRSPEVSKVYTGSFADDRVKEKREETAKDGNPLGTNFFEEEQQDLLRDLEAIPMQSRDRKISEFTKRVRAAKTHLIVAHNLRKKLPWFGKEAAERRLLDNLDIEFTKMKNDFSLRTFELAPGDFPSAEEFRSVCLAGSHIRSFPLLSESEFRKKIAMLDDVLQRELPNISRMEEL